jgi:hypothetical protein
MAALKLLGLGGSTSGSGAQSSGIGGMLKGLFGK